MVARAYSEEMRTTKVVAHVSPTTGSATDRVHAAHIQTAVVPAGGGGVFDVTIPKAGIYPFVSHSFASVMLGEVGLLNVGNVAGTMSH